MPSLTKKHKDQLKNMYKKFCERNKLDPKDNNTKKAFQFGYKAGHRVARAAAVNEG